MFKLPSYVHTSIHSQIISLLSFKCFASYHARDTQTFFWRSFYSMMCFDVWAVYELFQEKNVRRLMQSWKSFWWSQARTAQKALWGNIFEKTLHILVSSEKLESVHNFSSIQLKAFQTNIHHVLLWIEAKHKSWSKHPEAVFSDTESVSVFINDRNKTDRQEHFN